MKSECVVLKKQHQQQKNQSQKNNRKSSLHFHAESGQFLLIKESDSSDPDLVIREVQMFNCIPHHTNLVKLLQSEVGPEKTRLFFTGGQRTLLSFVNENGRLSETLARSMFKELLQVVSHLHSIGILHTNIKAETILVKSDLSIMLCDLEYARFFQPSSSTVHSYGSLHYAPPEMFREIPIDGPEIDTWALGVTLYAMVAGCLPWRGEGREVACQICSGNIVFPGHFSQELISYLQKILNINRQRRLKTVCDLQLGFWLTGKSD